MKKPWLKVISVFLAALLSMLSLSPVCTAVTGIDLSLNVTNGTGTGTVGTAQTLTTRIYNNGTSATPGGVSIYVHLFVDGSFKEQKVLSPVQGYNYAIGANGQAYWERFLDWSWTPDKDGNHLLEFRILTNNYTDVSLPNNSLIYVSSVTDPSNCIKDTVDFGNTSNENSHSITTSGTAGISNYNEYIGKVQDIFDYRYADGTDSGFTVSIANTSGKYGTLAIREAHPAVSSAFRNILSNPDQTGTGSGAVPIDVDGTTPGQTFTTGPNTTYIPSIAVQVEKVGLVSATYRENRLILRMYESPYKNKLLAESSMRAASIPGGYQWVTFNFEEDVGVLPNTQYYFELTTASAFNYSNRYVLIAFSTSTYNGGSWYEGGTIQTGKTLSFKTGPNITTSYDVEVAGQQVGGYDQLSTGSNFLPFDVNNSQKPGQAFAVGNVTELQAIAVQIEKAGTIPANNILKLTLYDTPTDSSPSYLATAPWSTGIIAEAVLTPQSVPGGYNYATFVFPQKVFVYPGRTYYFELSTALAYNSTNRYVTGVFGTSTYSRGTFYLNRTMQNGKTLSFKTSHNPVFRTRNLCDRGNGALTYYIDLPLTYAASNISVTVKNKTSGNRVYIDKMWHYTGFNSYAARYDVPLYMTPQASRNTPYSTAINLPGQVDIIKSSITARNESYLGGNTVKRGFTIEAWFAKDFDIQSDIDYIFSVAESKDMPVNMFLNSTWGGTPELFSSVRYDQILFSTTDNYSDPGLNTLPQRFNYAGDARFGRTVPNFWGNTPWLTFNNGGFINPAPDTLNGYKKTRLSLSTDQINNNLLDLTNSGKEGLLLSMAGENEPWYWAHQMDTEFDPVSGYPSVNSGNMRIYLHGDFGPDAYDQALADGVTLNPLDGISDVEKQWFQANLTNYNDFIHENIHQGTNKGVTKVINNAVTYPTDAARHNLYTACMTLATYPLFDLYHPLYETGVLNNSKTGLESYAHSDVDAYVRRITSNLGRTANLNQESSGMNAATYDKNVARSFMMGLRYITLYNIVTPAPTINTAFTNKINEFTRDSIKIATLVDQRRKSLTTAAERDAVILRNEITAAVQPGDTLAQTYLSEGNTAYGNGAFNTAYQKYIAAECAAASLLPAPFMVSGSAGNLSPYPVTILPAAGGVADAIIQAYSSSTNTIEHTIKSSISGNVTLTYTGGLAAKTIYVDGVNRGMGSIILNAAAGTTYQVELY